MHSISAAKSWKKKVHVFDGPQIRKLINDLNFKTQDWHEEQSIGFLCVYFGKLFVNYKG